MIKKLLVALMVIGGVSAEPITVFTTKKFEGDTVIVLCEYTVKKVVPSVYRVYKENGELVSVGLNGEIRFKESNVLWYEVKK